MTGNPAALCAYDPAWPVRAAKLLCDIRAQLSDRTGADVANYEHIGSTSAPGLAAKPVIDLQVRFLPLPDDKALTSRLLPLGWHRAYGSTPPPS